MLADLLLAAFSASYAIASQITDFHRCLHMPRHIAITPDFMPDSDYYAIIARLPAIIFITPPPLRRQPLRYADFIFITPLIRWLPLII